MKKRISLFLVIVMLFSIFYTAFPELRFPVKAAGSGKQYRFNFDIESPVVVIDEKMVADKGTNNFVIPNGAFSVTVSGNVDVTILFGANVDSNGNEYFDGITIDRHNDYSEPTQINRYAGQLYEAGKRLGWKNNYIPTCPFLITNHAKVHASFAGPCNFVAGSNQWKSVLNNGQYEITRNGNNFGGYAGIQVDGNASLTIDATLDGTKSNGSPSNGQVNAYGCHQFFRKNGFENAIDFNPILLPKLNGYDVLGGHKYARPDGTEEGQNGGGAGIGGGVSYDTPNIASSSYSHGTPGEIIINDGKITAVGGHQAAGIGGGVNSASTKSQIVINGGDITAIGGRWASGIGDGDSDGTNTSTTYKNKQSIVINGGTVGAYGGVAASGIGTTDKISYKNEDYTGATHGLTITIAGGEVKAHSGEADIPDNTLPKDLKTATAAIGVGQETDMRDNSITIYAAAKIQAVSFSQYAISNYGVDGKKIPTVNIDPDGYMYLARFTNDDVFSEKQRIFECYAVRADSFGNPMLIAATQSQLMDPVFMKNYKGPYYAYNPDDLKYYLVNEDGSIAQPPPDMLGVTDTKGRFEPNEIPGLSFYYDTNKVIARYVVPAKYKAIATTLPDPSMAGSSGTYILRVPDPNVTDTFTDDIFAVITKKTPGTTSGEIVKPGNDTQGNQIQHHVQKGENGKNPQNPNIKEDDLALPLNDIKIFIKGDNQNDLIAQYNGSFVPTTYGYTIFVPSSTTDLDLRFKFQTKGGESIKITTNAKIAGTGNTYIDSSNNVTGGTVTSEGTLNFITHTISISNSTNTQGETLKSADLWIEKTDQSQTASGKGAVVVYKITINVKPTYDLAFDDMNKVYDGVHQGANVNSMFERGEGFAPPKIDDLGLTDVTDNITYDFITDSNPPEIVWGYDQREFKTGRTYEERKTETISVYNTFSFTNSDAAGKPLSGSAQIKTDIIYTDENGNSQTKSVTTTIDFDEGKLGPTGTNESMSTRWFTIIQNVTTDGKATIQLQTTRSDKQKNYTYTILELNFKKKPQDVITDITDKNIDTEVNNMIGQMKTNMINKHLSSASTVVSVPTKKCKEQQKLKIVISDETKNAVSTINQTYSKEYISKQHSKMITLTCEYDQDFTDELKKLPSNSIVYTYYKDPVIDKNGKITGGTVLTTPPKDVGNYAVTAEIYSHGFEAYGIHEYTITQKQINPSSIKNWRYYLNKDELKNINSTTKIPIKDYGEIYFEGLVQNEKINIEAQDANDICSYYNGGNPLTISFSNDKIRIYRIRIVADDIGKNYVFPDAKMDGTSGYYTFTVYGEIAYEMDEAIFKKEEDVNAPWDKFWPTTEETPLDFTEGAGDSRIDYHSPQNDTHREYVYLYTINGGNNVPKYSVDIEFGSMRFTYSKTVWNVNTHQYDDVGGVWTGNDGTTNQVKITNRSNRAIYYSAQTTLHDYYGRGCKSTLSTSNTESGATPNVQTISGQVNAVVFNKDTGVGTAEVQNFYLYMSGVPQISAQDGGIPTGTLVITLSMNDLSKA